MIALASDHVTFWWITLGLGVVVAAAVVVLLQLLVTFVKDIDAAVLVATEEAGGVAAQTEGIQMLGETVSLAEALRDETRAHAEALSAVAGGDRG
jgi:hypothetical protein